jgi:hypothetical protein
MEQYTIPAMLAKNSKQQKTSLHYRLFSSSGPAYTSLKSGFYLVSSSPAI